MAYRTKNPILFKFWGMPKNSIGHIKIQGIKCKKRPCFSCPHWFYAYWVTPGDKYPVEKYLGACDRMGRPRTPYVRETQQLTLC